MDSCSIKFYKDTIADIINGTKTLDVRPRSNRWINSVKNSKYVKLTSGPRFKKPMTFAIAKISLVEMRPFETITKSDLLLLEKKWHNQTTEVFIKDYTDWFVSDLAKGFEVAWIYFYVTEVL